MSNKKNTTVFEPKLIFGKDADQNACFIREVDKEDITRRARDDIKKLLNRYMELSESNNSDIDIDGDELAYDMTEHIISEFDQEDYKSIMSFYKNTHRLYHKIIEATKKSPVDEAAFQLGRIVGTTQVAGKIADKNYNTLMSLNMLERISDGKDLKEILIYCQNHNPAYNSDICKQFQLNANNLTKKMKCLIDFELVTRHQSGRIVYYKITSGGLDVLKNLPKPEFIDNEKVQYIAFGKSQGIYIDVYEKKEKIHFSYGSKIMEKNRGGLYFEREYQKIYQ